MYRFLMAACGAAALMAGCATPPEGLLDRGERFDFEILRTPYSAAICIARNANGMGGGVHGEERTLGQSSTEVVVRPARGASDTMAIVQINYVGPYSKATVSVNRSRSDRAAFARRLMDGC